MSSVSRLFLNSHILYLGGDGRWGGGVVGLGGYGGGGRLLIIAYTRRLCPKGYVFKDRPFQVFFNFQHGQGKETTGNERVKISKIALSENDL